MAPGPVTVAGYAWSGHGQIEQVDISIDGGANWRPARLERAGRRSWARFQFGWEAVPGRFTLMARATDERLTRQPPRAAWNGKGYGQNGIHRVAVAVRAGAGGNR